MSETQDNNTNADNSEETSLAKRIYNVKDEASQVFEIPDRDAMAAILADRLEKAVFMYKASTNESDKAHWYEEGVMVFCLLNKV